MVRRPGLTPKKLLAQLQAVSKRRYSTDQKLAILHGEGPLWITAGPGSGKSEVLVARTLKLILCDGVDPASVILTTFTEKAAANLSNRMSNYLDDLKRRDVDITGLRVGTLHSLCNSIMREYRYSGFDQLEVLDDASRAFFLYERDPVLKPFEENWTTLRWLFSRLRGEKYPPPKWQRVEAATFIFDRITEYLVDVDRMRASKEPAGRILAEAYGVYLDTLQRNFKCDLALLQTHFLRFLDSPAGGEFLHGDAGTGRPPVLHVLVDEYQDTNPIQEAIYFRLADQGAHNLVVVGDDDQAMYRFRGGTVDALVEFGTQSMRRWKTDPTRCDLNENHRSHPEIVTWFNDYITSFPEMRSKGARAPGKRPMVSRAKVSGRYPAVSAVLQPTLDGSAMALADLLLALKAKRKIKGWEEVAILLHSTRETKPKAKPYVEALRGRDVKVYNPRSRAMQKDSLVQTLLGALTVVLDDGGSVLRSGEIKSRAVVDAAEKWITAYEASANQPEGKPLRDYVRKANARVRKLRAGEPLSQNLLDILYRILSYEPFRTKKKDAEVASQLSMVTSLLDSLIGSSDQFTRVPVDPSGGEGRVSRGFLRSFYYRFAGYIQNEGMNEQEDPLDLIPKGYVQVMTVHQAKGLEFPITIVGSLDSVPKPGRDHLTEDFLSSWCERQPTGTADERARQDLIRRFYVASSRAKNLLIYCGVEGKSTPWALGGQYGR